MSLSQARALQAFKGLLLQGFSAAECARAGGWTDQGAL